MASANADLCHRRNIVSKWSKDRGEANVSYQTRTETFSVPAPLPSRLSFGYQDNLPVQCAVSERNGWMVRRYGRP
jgi:hypothetical protein